MAEIDAMTEFEQRELSRLISLTGQLLLQHGAESKLVCDACCRMGVAFGLDSVELSLSASSIVMTTISHHHCITTTRRCPDRGINMRVVMEVHAVLLRAERENLSIVELREQLDNISPARYNRWFVAFMVGLSCACFSYLSGGDHLVFFVTLISTLIAMLVRQELARFQFNPLLTFGCSAFVATFISSLGVMKGLGNQPDLAMASSVLFLVPGFPLVNAVSDLVKGFTNMGIARWVVACLLTISTCLGILAGMSLTGVWGWV